MTLFRHIHIRLTLLVLLGLVVIGTGAAFAATRTKTQLIGNGVVVVDTKLGYEGGEAAGTGMVLTSSGEVLTNNHVIDGATSITVVVPGTTHRYTARVVGYDVSDDVAVLKLVNASSLETISVAPTTVKIGDSVTAVGNAGGTGRLVSAKGTVTGLGRTITASDDNGSSEQLSGLIETNANVRAGDSGGPLENASGRVVGMDTAAATAGGGPFASYGATDAYAIPISKALSIAKAIDAGKASATIHIGTTAFLGVQVATDGYESGAVVAGLVSGGPAANAGIVAGDVITSIGGQQVTSPSDVQSIVLTEKPGQKVSVIFTDQTGSTQTATVTLGSGPAQ
jgi:S1-C subfamily serine protease